MQYRLKLSIADLPFAIVTDHRLIARFLESYFASFRSDGSPAFSINVDSGVPLPVSAVRNRVVPEIEQEDSGEYHIVNNCSDRVVIGHIDKSGVACRLTGRACTDTYLLSAAVRVCVQFHLERNGGFFLHGACGSVAGRGVLFTGKSTAGKSTALRNLHPDTIIAEDAVALRMKGSGMRVYAIPFRGERPADTALDALCFPRKWTGTPKLSREGAASVATELAANALFCAPASEPLMAGALATIAGCSASVSGYECYFDKSTDLHAVFSAYGIFN
ncbi:MAG: hypothetical protein JW913_02460 [Chitinispirillaceae bacterium]|nr:hypothetical protein [Chitinispirillaceae bacterium]